MSGPTFTQVLHFDGGLLRRAADAWARLADAAERHAAHLASQRRAAAQAWDGPAAQTADHQGRRLQDMVDAAAGPLRRHRNLLAELADDGERLRGHARDLVARAAASGVRISPAGSVTAAGLAPEHAARLLATYQREVAEVCAEAARLDADAVRRLAELAPWPAGRTHSLAPHATVPERGSDPDAVHRWWRRLDPAQQRYLLASCPELVGALDGVPAQARDEANGALLARELERLTARRAELEQQLQELPGPPGRTGHHGLTRELDAIGAALGGLELIAGRRARRADERQRAYLLRFDPAGDGRVVFAVGNPDRADRVLTYVPGTGSSLEDLPQHLDRTGEMEQDATQLAQGRHTAAVYWLDYDAPDHLAAAASRGPAVEASDDLRRFADGLRATHTGGGSLNTFLGHSYGTTVIGQTAMDGLSADSVIFVGSPGVVAGSADALQIDADPAGHVWSTTAPSDPIQLARPPGLLGAVTAPAGQKLTAPLTLPLVHGADPSGPGFGARTFDADLLSGHSGYWEEGNQAREHIARVTVGHYHESSGR